MLDGLRQSRATETERTRNLGKRLTGPWTWGQESTGEQQRETNTDLPDDAMPQGRHYCQHVRISTPASLYSNISTYASSLTESPEVADHNPPDSSQSTTENRERALVSGCFATSPMRFAHAFGWAACRPEQGLFVVEGCSERRWILRASSNCLDRLPQVVKKKYPKSCLITDTTAFRLAH